MTDRPDTIEQQLIEQQRQYAFLENVCIELKQQNDLLEKEVERMRMDLVAAKCRPECKCGGGRCYDIYGGC